MKSSLTGISCVDLKCESRLIKVFVFQGSSKSGYLDDVLGKEAAVLLFPAGKQTFMNRIQATLSCITQRLR